MTLAQNPLTELAVSARWRGRLPGIRRGVAGGAVAVAVALAGCSAPAATDSAADRDAADDSSSASQAPPSSEDESPAEQVDESIQEETCDWDSPKLSGSLEIPNGQEGELSEALVGSWQHTHTDEGSGFEEVANDHRFVFPSSDRLLYCQHVPGATDHAENAANITLNDTKIELPGGKYGYTVTAWDDDTMLWDNPVGGGYIYLLQRR